MSSEAPGSPRAEPLAAAPGGGHPPHATDVGGLVRLVASGGGVEWGEVLAVLARHAETPIGRELATGLRPARRLRAIEASLRETREARAALHLAGAPPWETIPEV